MLKKCLLLLFLSAPCFADPRNPLPATPDQIWQNDLDLSRSVQSITAVLGNNFINVQNPPYNAKGDGVTDDTDAFSRAVSVGGVIYVPKSSSYYKISSGIIINVASTTVIGFGNPEIRQTSPAVVGFNISSSNVTIDGIILTGYQSASANINENAIQSSGTVSKRITNITIKNCTISNWGEQGIRFDYVNGAVAKNNHVYNIVYSGIQGRHTDYADFSHNHVHDLGPGDGGVLVGISLTGTTTQADVPYMGVISKNRVYNLLYRYGQGILVEPGDSCVISGNTITDVGFGIGVESFLTLISKNNVVSNNTVVNSTLTSYANRITGILMGGTDANTLNSGDSAFGNRIYGYGTNDPAAYGAMHLYYNENCSVTDNNISSAAVFGIYLLAANKNCTISGNNISSMTTSGASAGIATASIETDDGTLIDGNNINVSGANAILIQAPSGRLKIGKNYMNTTAIADISGANTFALNEFLHRDAVVAQFTGTLNETTLRVSTVSANSFGKNQAIRVSAWGDKAGLNGNKTITLYWGTTAMVFNAAANDQNAWRVEADILATGASNTQTIYWKGWNGTTMLSAIVNPTENTATDVAIRLTGTLANTADFITQRGFIIERF